MEDREILELFFERDESAIIEVQKKYGSRCRTVARNILSDRQDEEECVNETFLKVWNNIPPANPKFLGAYLCKITRYTAINMLKIRTAAKRSGSKADILLDELGECVSCDSSVELRIEDKEILEQIDKFLWKQTDLNRKVLMLRYWYCFEISEIGCRMGISENNVSVILSRTRAKLKRFLKKEGYEI